MGFLHSRERQPSEWHEGTRRLHFFFVFFGDSFIERQREELTVIRNRDFSDEIGDPEFVELILDGRLVDINRELLVAKVLHVFLFSNHLSFLRKLRPIQHFGERLEQFNAKLQPNRGHEFNIVVQEIRKEEEEEVG